MEQDHEEEETGFGMHHYAGVGSTCWWGTRLRARNHTGVVIEENGQPERNQRENLEKKEEKFSDGVTHDPHSIFRQRVLAGGNRS